MNDVLEKRRAYYIANRERILKRVSKYRKNNLEKCRKYGKEHYLKNKEAYIERATKFSFNNPEKVRGYKRKSDKTAGKIWDRNNIVKTRIQARDRYAKNPDKHRLSSRKFYQDNKEYYKTYEARIRKTQKYKARQTFYLAVKNGKIIRPTSCSRCNSICKPHGHHEDYSKPLEVVWLCKACHAFTHRL